MTYARVICFFVAMCVCVNVCVYVCLYIYIYIYIYIYVFCVRVRVCACVSEGRGVTNCVCNWLSWRGQRAIEDTLIT